MSGVLRHGNVRDADVRDAECEKITGFPRRNYVQDVAGLHRTPGENSNRVDADALTLIKGGLSVLVYPQHRHNGFVGIVSTFHNVTACIGSVLSFHHGDTISDVLD